MSDRFFKLDHPILKGVCIIFPMSFDAGVNHLDVVLRGLLHSIASATTTPQPGLLDVVADDNIPPTGRFFMVVDPLTHEDFEVYATWYEPIYPGQTWLGFLMLCYSVAEQHQLVPFNWVEPRSHLSLVC
jgi:hypothetical protein